MTSPLPYSRPPTSDLCPPSSDYLGPDPVGTRYAAMQRGAWQPATLAHHLGKSVAEVLPVLRNESDDAAMIKLVDCSLGLIPSMVDPGLLEDEPEEKPIYEMSTDEILEELSQGFRDIDALTAEDSALPAPRSTIPASEDPEYLAELAADETLHMLPQEPDYATARNVLLTKLFDVFRESKGEITLESIDRDMNAARGTARNVVIGDARHAKVEDYLCWLTDMQREQCWPPDGESLRAPWPRLRRRTRLLSPVSRPLSPVPTTPKGPNT